MPVKSPRRYHSPQRAEQAGATARHILRAAEQLFAERGFGAVTMKAIAQAAGVAQATVYLHFDGKAAIVSALADEVAQAPELSVEHVEAPAGGAQQLRRGAQIIGRLNARSWLLADILRSNSGTDPELKAVWERWQQRHLHAMRRAAAALAQAGRLRDGLSVEQATDVLYAVAGTDVYRLLVRERGWSAQQYEAWLEGWAARELLAQGPGGL
jgi:AcrR family transcriptional regulator